MQKLSKLCLLMLCILLLPKVHGQDLIERAQAGIQESNPSRKVSRAYEFVQMEKQFETIQVVDVFKFADVRRYKEADKYVDGHVVLDFNEQYVPRLLNSLGRVISLDIPVGGERPVTLELAEYSPLASDFAGKTDLGEVIDATTFPVRFYRGAVKDQPNSFATLTVTTSGLKALIGDDHGNYVLASFEDETEKYILYNDKKLKIKPPEDICHVKDEPDLTPEETQMIMGPEDGNPASRSGRCIEIFIEVEKPMYDAHGSVANVTNYLFALMNEVATLYNNDDMSISLKDFIIWTASNPYSGASSTSELREQFADYRQDNYNGRLAHIITTRFSGGIAYIDELCSTYCSTCTDLGPYSMSGGMSTTITPFPTYSWTVYVFTHEMGHTVGSRHTHACVWNGNNTAIDGCADYTEGSCPVPGYPAGGGTIMSYCHWQTVGINFNNGFHLQVGNLLRGKVNGASCTLDCGGSAGACPREIYHAGTIDSDTYYAEEKIESEGTVPSPNVVHYRCESTTFLKGGFKVNPGARFTAAYQACTPALEGGNDESVKTHIPSEEVAAEANGTLKQ